MKRLVLGSVVLVLVACGAPARPRPAALAAAVSPPPDVVIQGWPQVAIKRLAFDPTGAMLAAPLDDETLYFDVVTGTLTARAKPGEPGVFEAPTRWTVKDDAEWAEAGDVVAGARTTRALKRYRIPKEDYGVVHLWSRSGGDSPAERSDVRCAHEALSTFALSADGALLACAGDGGVVVLVDRATGKHTVHHSYPFSLGGSVGDLVFHPARPVLVSAGLDGLVRYDATDGSAHEIGQTELATAAAFSPDGSLLASGTATGDIDLWDTRSWTRVRSLHTRTLPILTAAVDPKAPRVYLAAGGLLGAAHEATWDLKDGGAAPRPIDKAPDAVAISPDGDLTVTARFDTLIATAGPDGKELWRKQIKKTRFDHVAFAGAGTLITYGAGYIATIDEDHVVRALDPRTGEERWSTPKELGYPAALAVSPDGALAAIALGRRGGSVEVLDTRTGAKVSSYRPAESARPSARASLALTAAGVVAITGVDEGALTIYDARKSVVVAKIPGVKGDARVAAGPALALADASGTLTLFDRGWRPARRVELAARAPAALAYAGATLVWIGQDGTGRAIDPATGAVTTFAATTRGAIVAVAPGGEYLAPRDAAGAVAFRWGDRAFPFEQFDAVYNDPATVLRAIGAPSPGALALFTAARARRLERLGLAVSGATRGGAVPTVTMPEIPPVSNDKRLRLHLTGADPSRRLTRLHVDANGVPVFGARGKALAPNIRFETDVELELAPGPNKVQVAVENEAGILSLEATAVTTYVGAAPAPKLHVYSIGVTRYRDRSLDLTFPAKDARDVAAALCADGRCAPTVLVDAAATGAAVTGLRAALERTAVEDTVVVYVSGHGVLDRRGGYLFAPHDVDVKDLDRTGVPYADLEGLLDGIPARHKLLVMDTCHAGELDPDEARAIAEGGKVRASAPSAQLGAASARAKATRDLFADLRRGTGTHVLASSSGVEYSLEDPSIGNSVFTHALLAGLREPAPVRVSTLRAFVTKRVAELTAGHQTPTTRRENLDADFELTPETERAARAADSCRRDSEGAYSCGQLTLQTFAVSGPPDAVLAAARRSLDAAAKGDDVALAWTGARFVGRTPSVAHPVVGGVAAVQPDERGGTRLVICRAAHALPIVLERCDRAIVAISGAALPELLPP